MEYLLEIYTEEIPAAFLNGAVRDLKVITEKKLSEYSIKYKKIETFGTPKRLTLYIKGLDEKEEDKEIEIKGPPLRAVMNENGTPKPLFEKFLNSNGLKKEDTFVKETEKGKYLYGRKTVKGKYAEEVVKETSVFALTNLHFPKSMHWINKNIRFVRPVRHILALLNEKVVNLEFADVKSDRKTFGLRIDKPKEIEVNSPNEYFKKLKENYVILSFDERKQIVERRSREEAQKVNGTPLYSKTHLEEITNLTEYPTPFLASIGKEATSIPQCIVQSIIEGHMKSFAVSDGKGHLLPYFIGVRNGLSDFIEIVRSGYEKVVRARVLDGKFFFEEDKKVKLESLVNKLSGVVFMKGLGTMKDKTERLVKLSETAAKLLNLDQNSAENLKRAAFLSKADLLTNVVREFTDLQGTMGGIYAEIQGENKEVSAAISEQYLPKFSGDSLPKSTIGKYLSLIDKIDTITGSFGINVKVSGSKDPFGLRRAGNGIMQIVSSFESETYFPLEELIDASINIHMNDNKKVKNKKKEVMEFLKDREKAILKEKRIRYDVINAVIALPIDLTPTYLKRAKVLMKHLNEETLEFIALSNKRVSNILEKSGAEIGEVDKNLFAEHDEENLFSFMQNAETAIKEHMEKADYEKVMEVYFTLHPVIAQFFDNVLVMDKDEKIKRNRLALLKKLESLFKQFADFSEIVIERKN